MKLSRFSSDCIAAVVIGLGVMAVPGQAVAQRPIGIDVSSYQGSSINWSSVKSSGVTFAWAKATEGTFYIDADFTVNEANAKAAGVYIGAYHFAHPEEDIGTAGADAEAAYFWNQAKNYLKGGNVYLVPMLDFEENYSTSAYMSDWINEWCQDIKNYAAANGAVCNPVVYTEGSIASDLESPATNWPLDIADPNNENPQTGAPGVSLGPWPTWTFWQYTWTESVLGGDGDTINGDASTLAKFLITSSGTVAGPGVTLDWNKGSGGAGTWNTSTANWLLSGTGDVIWSTGGDYADFAETAGTVTLGADVEADGLDFDTAGYVITGSDILTLNSPGNINVVAGTPTYIECVLSGVGYNLSGGGVLVLNNADNASGNGSSAQYIIGPNTTLVVNNDTAVGNAGVTLNLQDGGIYQDNDTTSGDQFLLPGSAIALLSGGGVFDNPNASLTMTNYITGPGSLTIIGTTYTLTLTDTGNNYTGGTIVQSGTLKANAAGVMGSSSGALTVSGGTLDLNGVSHTAGAVTISGGTIQSGTLTGSSYTGEGGTVSAVLAGSGAWTQTSGTTTLSGNNTYTGTTTINGGLLVITADNNLGAAPGSAVANQLTLNNTSTGNYGLRCTGSPSLSAKRGITLGANGGSIQVSTGNTLTVPCIITGSAGLMCGTEPTIGEGTLILSGANTYTGATSVASGTLQLGATGALPSTTALTVASAAVGGVFNMNNYSQTIGSLASSTGINGTGTTTPTVELGSGPLTVSGPGSGTFGGLISGSGGLTISGTGTLTLTGANTYTGATTVNGTTGYSNTPLLSISTASALGSTLGLTLNNGTLKNNDTSPTLGSGLTITLGASGGYFDAGWAPSEPITINGEITGTGALYINLDGSPVVLANTGNNYTGNTVIGAKGPGWYSSGTQAWLQLGAAGVIPNGSGYGNVTINGGTGYLGELDLNGYSQTINGLSGSGTVESSSGSPILTVGNNNATSAFSGVIENGSGTVALTKVGTGTLSLAGGNNTYTGATTISAGTLQLAGSVTSSSETVGNYNFAAPAQSAGGWTGYSGLEDSWTFTSAGIAANGSPWYSVNSPSGTQAAYIQGGSGNISQSITFPSTGGYQVSWEAIGRGGSGGAGSGPQTLILEIDGNPIESFTPPNTAWTSYTSPVISLTAGAHTVAFQGTATIDNSTCITAVAISGLSGSGGSISSTPTISIAAGATYDVSAISSYVLSTGTTLSAGGTSSAATIKGGTTVSLGSQPIILAYDGSHPALTISQGSLSLNGNAFTVNGSPLAAGTYTIIQQTSGTMASSGSYSVTGTAIPATGATGAISVSGGSVILTITDATTTTLNSLTPSTYGQAVTFTATVAPMPVGGTVQFYDNGVALGNPVTVSSGTASYSTNALSVGSNFITASYSGTTGYAASSTTGSSNQQVNAAGLRITAGAQSKTYGQTVIFGSGSTNFSSSGLQNGDTIGTVTLAISGNGGASNAPVSGSPYTITPSAATGGTFNATNYTLTYNPGALTVYPASLTVAVNNSSRPYGATNPAFSVTYSNFVNGETLGTSDVAGSPALSTGADTNSPVGAYDITNSLGTLTSTNYSFNLVDGTLTVSNALSSNVVSSSENPALPGDSVTFTATLSALAPSLAVPGGAVQFQIDGSPFGGPVTLSNGVAVSGSTASLSHGYHTNEADYAGNTNILGSTNTLIELINTPPVAGLASYSRAPNQGLTIAISNLLSNASDADGDALVLAAVSATSTNGAAITTNASDVFYSPPATNGNVPDAFSYTVADPYGATSSNLVIVTIQSVSNGPPVNITGISVLGNGTVQLNFTGMPGGVYLIEAATNLSQPIVWTTVGTNTADTNGVFNFTDINATNFGDRYYRTSTQ